MKKIKVDILQRRFSKLHESSFFYEGVVAETEHYKLYAVGDIMIYCYKNNEVVGTYNGKEYDIFPMVLENDKDLAKIGSGKKYKGYSYEWENNNWFEILPKDDDGEMGEVCDGEYTDSIEALKQTEIDFLQDNKKIK